MQFRQAVHIHFSLILLLLTLGHTSYSQDLNENVAEKLNNFRSIYPSEKAYLHTDKPYYATRDTIWFKAYLVEGLLHRPDSASKVLYVDLISQKTGSNVALRRVPLIGGLGYGSFTIANSIAPGAYTIRAYTNWMRNFPDDFIFKKEIYVFDEQESPGLSVDNQLDVTFFPESGQMVGGLNTRIAFKAINGKGLGVQINGFILDQNKDTIASIKSEHLGLGRFQFSPKPGDSYTAHVREKEGNYTNAVFPPVLESGYTIIVDNVSNAARMRVIVYSKNLGNVEKSVSVVAHSRGIAAFVANGKVSSKGLMMNIPTKELPDGILHLTLFNDENKPVAERLIFINQERYLKVKLSTSKATYKPREKTQVEIMVTDSAGKPAEANLSVSVTDANQVAQQPNDINLVSFLLLSSDLKGFVEQPGYYFDPTNSERKIYLDYLMMTQGWRRFSWEQILADSVPPPKRFVEQGFTIEGEVKRGNRKIAEKTPISVFLSNDSLNSFMTAESDNAGFFALNNLVFADSLQLRLQGMNKKTSSNLSFTLFPFQPPKENPVKIPFYPVTVSEEQLNASLKRAEEYQEIERKIRESRERLLDVVTIKGKKEEVRDTRKLYTTADASIKVTPQLAAGAMSVLDIIAGRVAGVHVTGSGMNASVSIRNGGEPLFVLDGMTVDKSMITNINVFEVESIDVLKGASAAIYGGRGGNGVISILTKRGNSDYDYSQDIIPGILVSKIAGFNIPRQFYAPKYDVKRQYDARPDYRSTIYWIPQIKTGKDGKAVFEFYNTDPLTTVNIRAEVLSPTGAPGFAQSVYSVQ